MTTNVIASDIANMTEEERKRIHPETGKPSDFPETHRGQSQAAAARGEPLSSPAYMSMPMPMPGYGPGSGPDIIDSKSNPTAGRDIAHLAATEEDRQHLPEKGIGFENLNKEASATEGPRKD